MADVRNNLLLSLAQIQVDIHLLGAGEEDEYHELLLKEEEILVQLQELDLLEEEQ